MTLANAKQAAPGVRRAGANQQIPRAPVDIYGDFGEQAERILAMIP
jgi:hypothetical protein